MQVTTALERLLAFARANGLLAREDTNFARNMLLAALGMDAPEEPFARDDSPLPPTATPMLSVLLAHAESTGIVGDDASAREQFSAHLMNLLTPPPSAVIAAFESIRKTDGIRSATNWFYAFCRANDYVRVDEIARNVAFLSDSPYGRLEITINLSKPEKDPREIARLKNAPSVGYPRCMLCVENEGYAGRPGYPTHETLRTIPVTLCGEAWRFQYSPYVYYPEHCIVLNERHIPMALSRRTFSLLFDFLRQFPHYCIGSNADLPIVGGSILNHDHFQGGCHLFPMEKAAAYRRFAHSGFAGVAIEAVRWPMTCLRLTADDPEALTTLADSILTAWRTYDDPAHDVLHETDQGPHNTLTPIARMDADGRYCLHLVLRNNRTTKEHPLGLFHPHDDLHHIKRENIGLIEVMGLFILPGRLCDELDALATRLTGEAPLTEPAADDPLAKHYPWLRMLAEKHGTALSPEQAEVVLRDAVGQKCARVLEDAGVFKANEAGDAAFARFLAACGILPV